MHILTSNNNPPTNMQVEGKLDEIQGEYAYKRTQVRHTNLHKHHNLSSGVKWG